MRRGGRGPETAHRREQVAQHAPERRHIVGREGGHLTGTDGRGQAAQHRPPASSDQDATRVDPPVHHPLVVQVGERRRHRGTETGDLVRGGPARRRDRKTGVLGDQLPAVTRRPARHDPHHPRVVRPLELLGHPTQPIAAVGPHPPAHHGHALLHAEPPLRIHRASVARCIERDREPSDGWDLNGQGSAGGTRSRTATSLASRRPRTVSTARSGSSVDGATSPAQLLGVEGPPAARRRGSAATAAAPRASRLAASSPRPPPRAAAPRSTASM